MILKLSVNQLTENNWCRSSNGSSLSIVEPQTEIEYQPIGETKPIDESSEVTSSPLPVEPVHPQVVSESEQNPSQGGSSVPVPVQPPPTVAINKNSTDPRITPPAVEPGGSVKLSHRLTIFLQCCIVFLGIKRL